MHQLTPEETEDTGLTAKAFLAVVQCTVKNLPNFWCSKSAIQLSTHSWGSKTHSGQMDVHTKIGDETRHVKIPAILHIQHLLTLRIICGFNHSSKGKGQFWGRLWGVPL